MLAFTIKDTARSFIIVSIFLLISIGVNLAGYSIAYTQERMFYIDTIGTALASVAYGPIHGALVGVSSNLIASVTLAGNDHYIMFAMVHIWLALLWGLAPRLLNGTYCDFFNPVYSYRQLFTAVLLFSVLGGLVSSIVSTLIATFSKDILTCKLTEGVPHFERLKCALYGPLSLLTDSILIKRFVSDLVISFPDKFVSFACAIFLIEKVLPQRRLKLTGKSGDFVSTNRWSVSFCVLLAFCYVSYLGVEQAEALPGFDEGVALATVTLTLLTFAIVAPISLSRDWHFAIEKKILLRNVYEEKNPNADSVFSDACHLSIVYYFVFYIMSYKIFKTSGDNIISENLTSAISVAVFITTIEFVFTFFGRFFERKIKADIFPAQDEG